MKKKRKVFENIIQIIFSGMFLLLAAAFAQSNTTVKNNVDIQSDKEAQKGVPAQESDFIAFDSEGWDLAGSEVTEHLGRKAIAGRAILKDVEFENGVIEVDLAVTGRPSYPGIIFRMQTPGEYERIYLRPHRENLYPDAVQYVAAFNGIDSWQLYNGEGYTAGAQIPAGQWIPLKLEVHGSQASLFLNNAEQPALEIKYLQHGTSKGNIALQCPRDKTAYFSNFRFKSDNTLKFEPAPPQETPLGIIKDWEISQIFKANQVDLEKTPAQQGIPIIEWQKAEILPAGLVDISRYQGRQGADPDLIWARTRIRSDKNEVKQFAFGYSDYITIFLNGQILFAANSGFRQRDPSFLGIVGLNDYVYLPLKKGDNELLLLVAESFGGWAFIFQDINAIFEHERLTKLWEIPHQLQYPESVLYDQKREILYVSNFFNNGKEFISRVTLDGKIETLEWITGLNRPTGISLFNDTLYVVDRAGLLEIDVESGQIVNRYTLPGARFPNDVAVDANGSAYVSDSAGNAIYRCTESEFEVWLQNDETLDPNTLMVDGDQLIMGTSSDGCLKAVDLEDKTVTRIACLGSGSIMDGVKPDGTGGYLISDFNGRVFQVSQGGNIKESRKIEEFRKTKKSMKAKESGVTKESGKIEESGKMEYTLTELLNTKVPQKFCADFEYIIDKKLLIIPTLNDNRIMTYQLAE
jgi:DNA-binding beta-propeller fold protein YncE